MAEEKKNVDYHEKHLKFLQLIGKDERGNYVELEVIQKYKKEKNIDVNYADYDSRTALHIAAAENRKDVVLFLLKENAESKPDFNEDNPIDCTRDPEIKSILGEGGPELRMGPGRILLYTRFGEIDGVSRCLLKYGSTAATFPDYDDRTALHIACTHGKEIHQEIVRLLLANGANPKAEDRFGKTPEDNARAKNNVTFIEIMKSHTKGDGEQNFNSNDEIDTFVYHPQYAKKF